MTRRKRSKSGSFFNRALVAGSARPNWLVFPSIEAVIATCVAAAVIGLAVHELRLTARFSDLMLLGERIERQQTVGAASVEQRAGYAEQVSDQGVCRSDILLAGVTAVLRRLDNGNPVDGYTEWWRSLLQARDYIAFALSCTPRDSNLWLRYAIIDTVIAEEPEKLARLMAMAVKLAPADQSDLLSRLYFWNRLSKESLKAAEAEVQGDMQQVYGRVVPSLIASAVPSVSPALKPYAAAAIARLSQDRKNILTRGQVDLKGLSN